MKSRKTITEPMLKKYFEITGKALEIVKKSINKKREKEAKIIIDMAQRYYDDAKFFKNKGDYINSFGALYYSHGWIDTGAKLGIFDVTDDKLFVIK